MLWPAKFVGVPLVAIHVGGALLLGLDVLTRTQVDGMWLAWAVAPPVAGFVVLRHWFGPLGTLPRDLITARFRLCGECGYALRYRPNQGTCPECGGTYNVTYLVPMWRNWSRRRVTWRFFRVPLNACMLIAATVFPVFFALMGLPHGVVIMLAGTAGLGLVFAWDYDVATMAKSIPPWDQPCAEA
jgi:hypothetical protein